MKLAASLLVALGVALAWWIEDPFVRRQSTLDRMVRRAIQQGGRISC